MRRTGFSSDSTLKAVALVLLAALVSAAGCSTQPAPAEPQIAAPPAPTLPGEGGKALMPYILPQDAVPFPVKNAVLGSPGKSEIPAWLGRYGILRAFVAEYYEENDAVKTARSVRHVICELSEENATIALQDIRWRTASEAETPVGNRRVELYPDTGDGGIVFVIRYAGEAAPQYPDTAIAFRRGTVIEVITMKSPVPDTDEIQKLAEKAASLLPSEG